ncbi:MAG: hypothetical protein ACPGQS_12320, partial [Bradymonadia bacterium]
DDASLLERMPRLKDDDGLQLAALECLHHLKSREARRILFHASHEGKGKSRIVKRAEQLWELTKNIGYGEPTFPRSFHDPEWTEEDIFDFEAYLDSAPSARADASRKAEKSGVVGWVKSLFGTDSEAKDESFESLDQPEDTEGDIAESNDPSAVQQIEIDSEIDRDSSSIDTPVEQLSEDDVSELIEPEVGLRIEAMIQRASRAWTGDVPMVFAFHRADDDDQDPLYTETQSEVRITAGRFEVVLGEKTPLPDLPKKVWLSIEIDGQLLDQKLEVTPYRSVIQG